MVTDGDVAVTTFILNQPSQRVLLCNEENIWATVFHLLPV